MSIDRDQELNDEQLRLLEATHDFAPGVGVQEGLLASITIDHWGNEWDGGSEFSDMDFRLIDE